MFKPSLAVLPIMLLLSQGALGQEMAPAPQAPTGAAPVEQAAPANTTTQAQPTPEQAMQQQAPEQQVPPLPVACAPAPGLSGSEQSMGTADMGGLEHLGEGNDQMISVTSALQVQIKSAVAQENIDIAYACALVALFNGLQSLTQVQSQYGKNTEIRDTANRVLSGGQQEIGRVVDWLNTQQPSESAAQ